MKTKFKNGDRVCQEFRGTILTISGSSLTVKEDDGQIWIWRDATTKPLEEPMNLEPLFSAMDARPRNYDNLLEEIERLRKIRG